MAYLFKDTDLAARRLRVVANVFSRSTRAFLHDIISEQPEFVIDLGCGPGYTTHLLDDMLQSRQVVGLDNSSHFVELAQRTATQRVKFYLHDITTVPFPVGPADLLSCRFLLTHLKDPQAVIERWATQVRPGGLLLMEEVEWIHTDNPLFKNYLDIQAHMLQHNANQLYIGPTLNALGAGNNLKKRLSRVYTLPVQTIEVALMFSMNIQSWKHQPFIQENYSATLMDQLEQGLQELTQVPDQKYHNEWGMRQIAFERV